MNVIGLDLGMGATKLWSDAGGKMVLSQVSAVTRQEIDLKSLGMTARKRPMVILNGSGRLLVGEGAPARRICRSASPARWGCRSSGSTATR